MLPDTYLDQCRNLPAKGSEPEVAIEEAILWAADDFQVEGGISHIAV